MSHFTEKTVAVIWSFFLLFGAGCSSEGELCPVPDERCYLKLSFSTAGMLSTKAGVHTDPLVLESDLKMLQIWVFNTGSEQSPIGYDELSDGDLLRLTDAYGRVSMIIPIDQSSLSLQRKLDIYVAANTPSVNLQLPAAATRADLENAYFVNFSPEEMIGSVPLSGLPVSRVIREIRADDYLSSSRQTTRSIDIPLVRAVSKLHFFFVRPQGLQEAKVRHIFLQGDLVPRREFFFPKPVVFSSQIPDPSEVNIAAADGYHPASLWLTPATDIVHEYANPASLVYEDGEEVQQYLRRLSTASVSDFGLTYLKETDRELRGSIIYTTEATGTVPQTAAFSLAAGSFVRNREWIVYAYFARDRLYLHPVVANWTDGGSYDLEWGYSTTLINQTGAEHTRILTENGTDYLMSAYGTAPSGLPYAPKLQLTARCQTATGATLKLSLDNPDFGFVTDEGGVLSGVMDYVEMDLSPVPSSVIFYVVPKQSFDLAGSNPENPSVRLNLFLLTELLAPVRLPFNAISLPGDPENILFHYVTPDMFK